MLKPDTLILLKNNGIHPVVKSMFRITDPVRLRFFKSSNFQIQLAFLF